jgi:hypothetical protein
LRCAPAWESVEWSELVGELVRGLLRFSRCEKLASKARGQFGNPEEGERPPLEVVTRKLVKTAD